MRIRLEHVTPTPLRGAAADSEIWNQDVQFEPGSRWLIQAPSGKGKTTLLSLLYGLRADYEGRVLLDGADVRAFRPEDWSRVRQRQMACVFQDFQLFDELTAWQNVRLKNELASSRAGSDIQAMFEALGLADKLQQPLATLSRGQKQRIAIIRALCQPFAWLLLDEPFSHLDPATARRAAQLIQAECQRQQAGLLLAGLEAESPLACQAVKRL